MSGVPWEHVALNPAFPKTCMESRLSTVQVESDHWTVHSTQQTQLGKKDPAISHPLAIKMGGRGGGGGSTP